MSLAPSEGLVQSRAILPLQPHLLTVLIHRVCFFKHQTFRESVQNREERHWALRPPMPVQLFAYYLDGSGPIVMCKFDLLRDEKVEMCTFPTPPSGLCFFRKLKFIEIFQ